MSKSDVAPSSQKKTTRYENLLSKPVVRTACVGIIGRWITWPDRFDGIRINGVWVLRCSICGEYWGLGECECEIGRP